MKWSEYLITRTLMKMMNEFEKMRTKSINREIKDQEIRLEKGYWSYNEKFDDYDYVEPKKNEHFVTTVINDEEKNCQVVISKEPKSIKSVPFDHPWEAEAFCSSELKFYRNKGYTTEVKREAPVVIVDSDICCPFCINSSSYREWALNSYKQELVEAPEKFDLLTDLRVQLDNLTIDEIETNKCWCPICNNGIEDRNLLITKGFEWKVDYLHKVDLHQHLSPYMKQLADQNEKKSYESKKVSLSDPREIINEPLFKISSNRYQGLVVKGTQTIKTREGLIQVPKWFAIQNKIPNNIELDSTPYTSYRVNTNQSWIPKRAKNEFPIIYIPIHELTLPYYYKLEEEKINEAKKMFHAGKLLEPIRITVHKECVNYHHLAVSAFEIGLTHVPAIVTGNYKEKRAFEKLYKENVKKIQREEKPMVKKRDNNHPHAYGTFIKKENRLYRTEAFIQWGNGEDILGTVIMLNPGSAKLQVDKLHDVTPIQNELTIDPTMESLIQMMEDFHSSAEKIKGRLCIYNLFPLQNAKSSKAVSEFEKLWKENESLVKSLPKSKDEIIHQINRSPWVLLGWGCGHRSPYLDQLKSEWLDIINQTKTPILGKVGKLRGDYYHPRPQLLSKQVEYRVELKKQFERLMSQEIKLHFNGIKDDTTWERHIQYYKPVEVFTIDLYRFLLFDINERDFYINYKYRLLCFIEGIAEPILALNHESSKSKSKSKSFFGATLERGHLNLGVAPQSMTIVEFKKWALENISQFIKGIDTKALFEKMKHELLVDDSTNSKEKTYDELMKRRVEHLAKQIREYLDRYEYCFIEKYEEEYEGFNFHAVPMENVNIVLIEVKDDLKLAGVEFDKSRFTIEDVATWLKQMNLYIGNKNNTEHVIEDGHQILDAFKFTGHVLALYRKGKENIKLKHDKLIDITEEFGLEYQKVDTNRTKGLHQELTILLNGQIMQEIPRLDFNRKNDMVISNGNLLKVDYIDSYNHGIGFYRYDEAEPVAVILDRQTTVRIDVYKKEDGNQICNIDHQYIINFDVVE